MDDTLLIVDDESAVRQTVSEWLTQAELGCRVLTASDAESALTLANEHTIDLCVLDWHLGAGDDGLQLLQDLAAFHPNIVAIMITGFANQATPLDAMRMGVRDYLDKNHDFGREALIRSVQKQLDLLRPAKQMRRLHRTLVAFRDAVQEIVPLVQSTAALNDPVPLPEAVAGLVRFLMQVTHARDGMLLVRSYDAARTPAEWSRVYDRAGQVVPTELAPFARSVAGSAVSRGQPSVMNDLHAQPGGVELQPFEKPHHSLLAVPMAIAPGTQVVLELFDRPGGFTAEDQQVAGAAAELGVELLRQALGQRQTHQLLFDAVAAALKASEAMLAGKADAPPVLDQLRAGLQARKEDPAATEESVRLAEAIHLLGTKYGTPALEHCRRLVEEVQVLLDRATGTS